MHLTGWVYLEYEDLRGKTPDSGNREFEAGSDSRRSCINKDWARPLFMLELSRALNPLVHLSKPQVLCNSLQAGRNEVVNSSSISCFHYISAPFCRSMGSDMA